MAKRRPITVTVTVADLDKAIAHGEAKIKLNKNYCPLAIAVRRHRKRKETIGIGYRSSFNDKSIIGNAEYIHYSDIPVLFDDDKHSDVYEQLPCKVTFYPIEAGSVASGWGSVTV